MYGVRVYKYSLPENVFDRVNGTDCYATDVPLPNGFSDTSKCFYSNYFYLLCSLNYYVVQNMVLVLREFSTREYQNVIERRFINMQNDDIFEM